MMTPLSSAENENQIENGAADDKQPLKNGINEKAHIVEATDRTDEAVQPEEGPLRSMFGSKNTKRKYKMYDNGKRSNSGLSPLTSAGRLRIEQTIKDRTGLTRTGFVLLILCILLTITLLVCVILWPKTAHSKQYPICVKPSCLRSSAEILPKLNTSEAPCADFQNYACGNWFSSKPLPKDRSEWNLKELLQYSYRRKIHELLVTNTVSTISMKMSSSWKLKNFYDSCMNVDMINSEDQRPLKKIIDSLGGWHVLKDFTVSQWDTYRTLKILHSQYHVSPFFQIDVVPDILNSKQNLVRLKPPSLGLPNKNYYFQSEASPVITSYLHFIKDVVQQFGATAVDARLFSQDLFNYEKRIAEILDLSSGNSTNSYTRLKMAELIPILFPIQFYDILLGTLPNANLNTDNYVLVENIEYFRKLPSLISTSDNVSLNKYLIWRLVAYYVPYLSEKYVETLQIFQKDFLDQNEPVPRWEFCIETLQRFAGFGLMALFENNMVDREPIASVVSQVFSETLNVIKKDVWNLKHTETQGALVEKMSTIGIQVGLPIYMLKKEYIEEYYSNFNAIKNDFFQNILYGVSFIQETLQKRLKNPNGEFKWLSDMISQPMSVSYSAAANKVIVPQTVLQFPYFEKDFPLTSLYGGLGREVASAIVFSLFLNKHHDNRTRNDKKDYVDMIAKCVLHTDAARLNISDKETFIVTLAGLKYAYNSLKNELSMIEHSHQPAMETFENEELFFIFYAQSLCSVKTEKRRHNENMFSDALNDLSLTNSVLKQLPEFTDRYYCESISKSDDSLCTI